VTWIWAGGAIIIVGVVLGNAGERAAELAAVRAARARVGQMTLVVATLLLFRRRAVRAVAFDPNAGGRNQMSILVANGLTQLVSAQMSRSSRSTSPSTPASTWRCW